MVACFDDLDTSSWSLYVVHGVSYNEPRSKMEASTFTNSIFLIKLCIYELQ